MFIRSREEALDAVAEILALPERRAQIIRTTVAIMQCLDADPREFLADCQLMLIEGGLDALRRKRREAYEQLEDNDLVVVIDPEENRRFEEIASAFDALRLSEIVREVFPPLTTRYQAWEVARAMIAGESSVQEQILAALKVRNGTAGQEAYDAALQDLERLIVSHVPSWKPRVEEMRRSCLAVVRETGLTDIAQASTEAEMLFSVIAASNERALPLVGLMDRDPVGAVSYVGQIHELTVALRAMDQEAGTSIKSVA